MPNVTTDTGAFDGLSSEEAGRALVQAYDAARALEEVEEIRNAPIRTTAVNGTLIVVTAAVAVFALLLTIANIF